LAGREVLVRSVLEAERGEQVLAHEGVLEFGGLADHVDQRFPMLDDELGLRLCRAPRPRHV
jgi:hypothetical protein